MKCYVCGYTKLRNSKKDYVCENCLCTLNKGAPYLTYQEEGGQDVPTKQKTRIRILNAKERFKLITPYIKNQVMFVDIGSGSGEMLQASTTEKTISEHLGFEPNKQLYDVSTKIGHKVKRGYYNKINSKKQKLFALCHVLEHMHNPGEFIKKIAKDMNKGDKLYIEVPSNDGISFKTDKYNWKLWYHEHFTLFSKKSLRLLGENNKLKIVAQGKRIFYNELNLKTIAKTVILHPLYYFKLLTHQKLKGLKKNQLCDWLMQDYCYILYEK